MEKKSLRDNLMYVSEAMLQYLYKIKSHLGYDSFYNHTIKIINPGDGLVRVCFELWFHRSVSKDPRYEPGSVICTYSAAVLKSIMVKDQSMRIGKDNLQKYFRSNGIGEVVNSITGKMNSYNLRMIYITVRSASREALLTYPTLFIPPCKDLNGIIKVPLGGVLLCLFKSADSAPFFTYRLVIPQFEDVKELNSFRESINRAYNLNLRNVVINGRVHINDTMELIFDTIPDEEITVPSLYDKYIVKGNIDDIKKERRSIREKMKSAGYMYIN